MVLSMGICSHPCIDVSLQGQGYLSHSGQVHQDKLFRIREGVHQIFILPLPRQDGWGFRTKCSEAGATTNPPAAVNLSYCIGHSLCPSGIMGV